jgi:hypothetical protein
VRLDRNELAVELTTAVAIDDATADKVQQQLASATGLTVTMDRTVDPTILGGVRLGLMLCFLAIIGGETIASLEGLGHRIVWYAEGMQMVNMFAYIVFVILIATAMNACLSLLELRRRGG